MACEAPGPDGAVVCPPCPCVHFAISCPFSGLSLLLRAFAASPACGLLLRWLPTSSTPSEQKHATHVPWPKIAQFISAQEIQMRMQLVSMPPIRRQHLVCAVNMRDDPLVMFPDGLGGDLNVYDQSRPVFLVRDPVRVYDSWKGVRWADKASFVKFYKDMVSMIQRFGWSDASIVIYERLISRPGPELQRVCNRWSIPFSERMLQFERPFVDLFDHFMNERSLVL
jgi:hypothetical protein